MCYLLLSILLKSGCKCIILLNAEIFLIPPDFLGLVLFYMSYSAHSRLPRIGIILSTLDNFLNSDTDQKTDNFRVTFPEKMCNEIIKYSRNL